MKSKILPAAILYASIFAGGCLVGKLVSVPGVTMGREINPVHALSILCTLVVAVLVSIHLDRNKRRDSSQRDIYLKRIEAVSGVVEELYGRVIEGPIPYTAVTSRIKRIRASLNALLAPLATAIGNRDFEAPLMNAIRELNEQMTKTDIAGSRGKLPKDISIKDNVITYSGTYKAQIESGLDVLRSRLFELQLLVNGCYPFS